MLSKAGFATLTPVRNMERAVKFYTKTLGGKLQMREKDWWASVRIGKEEFWLVKPSGSQAKKPDLAFSTFIVKDIKAEVTELRKKGARFERTEKSEWTKKIEGPISYDAVGATAFLKDSEGNLLMLFEAPK